MTEHQREPGHVQQQHEPWHIKREVSVGHLLTTLTLFVAALWWASGVEKRIAVLEVTSAQQAEVLQDRLNRIEDKLDKLIQRELTNGNH